MNMKCPGGSRRAGIGLGLSHDGGGTLARECERGSCNLNRLEVHVCGVTGTCFAISGAETIDFSEGKQASLNEEHWNTS